MAVESGKSDVPSDSDVWTQTWRHARRVVILVIGGSVVLLGLALIFLPGPAFVVIPAGLAILATEFVWARRLLRRARKEGSKFGRRFWGKRKESASGN